MADRKGTPREIATQGFSSVDGKGIATQGFIEPILGDLILGGEAGVVYVRGAYQATGGLVTGGAAGINRRFIVNAVGGLILDGAANVEVTFDYPTTGGLVTGGAAKVETTVTPVIGGNIITGGAATVSRVINVNAGSGDTEGGLVTGGVADVNITFTVDANGGLVTAGEAGVVFSTGSYVGTGGLVTGGTAGVVFKGGEFGRGGAHIPLRRRHPTLTWEPADFSREETPMDYLKKIQDALKKSTFDYISNGTIRISGSQKVTVVKRDLPPGEIVVANNPPLEPVELDLPHVFAKGATAREIAELEDQLFLNDILNGGVFRIKKGAKARFVHEPKRTVGGTAAVSFKSAADVTHFDRGENTRRIEDDNILLDIELKDQYDQEEEELRILGILD